MLNIIKERVGYSEREYHHREHEGHKVKLDCEILRVLRGRQVYNVSQEPSLPLRGRASQFFRMRPFSSTGSDLPFC